MDETVRQRLATDLRDTTQAFAAGDQTPPCAVLWPDPDRLWEQVIPELQRVLPELFRLGGYAPDERSGPALWLRCVEARLVVGASAIGTTPILYLPGISRERLRAAEDCPQELAALVELQYRGAVWLQVNGKDWTPSAYLASNHGGLALNVARDQATSEALAGALPVLIKMPVSQLENRRLDSAFFNGLVAPDSVGSLLRWLGDVDAFKAGRSPAEWKAFCEQCSLEFHLDPVREGPLKAAQFLAQRDNAWSKVWQRFADNPARHPGVVQWLRRAEPKAPKIFDSAEVWPGMNEREERKLGEALASLVDRPQDEVIRRIEELEAHHAVRRGYPWQTLGLSPLATALEHLALLATLCETAPGAATPQAYADYYASEGWQVDAAALATMAACGTAEMHGAVLGTLRAVYLTWLEITSRHLQQLLREQGPRLPKRHQPTQMAPGRVLLFADGLRMDVAQLLAKRLARDGWATSQDWEWSTIPSVTATAKPAASPIADAIQGGDVAAGFATRLAAEGKALTQDRFTNALHERGWQCLAASGVGDPSGSAWTEAGTLDKRGHNEGWKMARSVDTEVGDLASRIGGLIHAGWNEVVVVTDHGWLLLPYGLPKVELKASLVDDRWGRCASLKAGAQADPPTFKWHWNPEIAIASPPGVGCYRASMEYTHGGVSLQEMVTPLLRVTAANASGGDARLLETRWTGAKCRVLVGGPCMGCRVDVRTIQADPSSSLLANRQAPAVTSDGKVTLFLEDDGDIGKDAEIVLLDSSGRVIASQPTILGH